MSRLLWRTLLVLPVLLLASGGCGGGGGGGGGGGAAGADLALVEISVDGGWIEIANRGADRAVLRGLSFELVSGGNTTWPVPEGTLLPGSHTAVNAPVALPEGGGARLLDGSGRTLATIWWPGGIPAGASYGETSTGDWQALGVPTPGLPNVDPPALVLLNEVCPDNDTVYENPLRPGEYDDWIELYNAGEDPVDLGGFYLTNDLGEPLKWALPPGTVLPDGDYLVVHANGLDSGLQASFVLGAAGGGVALFAPDGSLVDAMAFPALATDRSLGRLKNGDLAWLEFTGPSPDASNKKGDLAALDDPAHRGGTPDLDRVFDRSQVRQIDLTLSDAELAALRADLDEHVRRNRLTSEFSYVEGTVECEGEVWEHVGVRYKGNASTLPAREGLEKISIKLDFDEWEDFWPETKNQRFWGLKKINLNNSFGDPTMLREMLTHEALEAVGAPVSRSAPYRLHVNGVYWGLYIAIEQVDERFLEDRFGSDEGNLYKPEGPGADLTRFVEKSYEKKTNEDEEDWSDVIALIEDLADPANDPEGWLDVDGFVPWIAATVATGNLDSYLTMKQNYYLYNDPDAGLFRFITWDHNLSFGCFLIGGYNLRTVAEYPVDDPTKGRRPLVDRVLERSEWREAYRDHIRTLLAGPLAEQAFEDRARELHELIRPHVTGVMGESYPHTLLVGPGDFDAGLDSTVESPVIGEVPGLFPFMDARRTYLADELR